MRLRCSKFVLSGSLALVSTLFAVTAGAQQAAQPAERSARFVDGIAAIVDSQVITLRQLDSEAAIVARQLQSQNIPLPDPQTLRLQVLNRLIDQTIQEQEGKRLGIVITPEFLDNAVKMVAERNKLTPEKLRQEITKTGMTWDDYLKTLRHDLLLDQLRQRMVDERIYISDAEVDAYLKKQGMQAPARSAAANNQAAAGPVYIELAQILVRVPEGSDSNTERNLRLKAEGLLARVKAGEDFAGVAAAASDGQEALHGGVLGIRPLEGWPDLFVDNIKNLSSGQVSGLVRSGQGYHILKVTHHGGPDAVDTSVAQPQASGTTEQGPMMVTQTKARHILIKLSQVRDDEQAKERIEQLKQRIDQGESFEVLARSNSEDSTAPLGGDLGWLTPGETVPAFEQAMDSLQPGQVSAPVRSQFGWHIIRVDDRRTKNMENEYRRMQARQHLFEQRVEPALDDWLSQLRGSVYIDNRLEKALSSEQ